MVPNISRQPGAAPPAHSPCAALCWCQVDTLDFAKLLATFLADDLRVERTRISPTSEMDPAVVVMSVAPPHSVREASAQTLALQVQVLLRAATSSFYVAHPELAVNVDTRVEPISVIGFVPSAQIPSSWYSPSALISLLPISLAVMAGSFVLAIALFTLVLFASRCCARKSQASHDPQELASLKPSAQGEASHADALHGESNELGTLGVDSE